MEEDDGPVDTYNVMLQSSVVHKLFLAVFNGALECWSHVIEDVNAQEMISDLELS